MRLDICLDTGPVFTDHKLDLQECRFLPLGCPEKTSEKAPLFTPRPGNHQSQLVLAPSSGREQERPVCHLENTTDARAT